MSKVNLDYDRENSADENNDGDDETGALEPPTLDDGKEYVLDATKGALFEGDDDSDELEEIDEAADADAEEFDAEEFDAEEAAETAADADEDGDSGDDVGYGWLAVLVVLAGLVGAARLFGDDGGGNSDPFDRNGGVPGV